MKVWVNDAERELPAGCTVAALVHALGLRPEQVAVERNQRLVPRRTHATEVLADGDRLEVVTLVGGG
ncbi:MAG: sulfur carrier protein ThiS [Planctomycetes bacterium]|nr:sulfur carrier protein ThiS [Planctomycetota bacterium]